LFYASSESVLFNACKYPSYLRLSKKQPNTAGVARKGVSIKYCITDN